MELRDVIFSLTEMVSVVSRPDSVLKTVEYRSKGMMIKGEAAQFAEGQGKKRHK